MGDNFTEGIFLDYLLHRLESINSNEYQANKRQIKAIMSTACGFQTESDRCMKDNIIAALDIIRKTWVNVRVGIALPDPAAEDANRRAIRQIFVNSYITWERIVALLEFTVQRMDCLLKCTNFNGVQNACEQFDWLVETFKRECVDKHGGTIKNWIDGVSGWNSLLQTSTAFQSRSGQSSPAGRISQTGELSGPSSTGRKRVVSSSFSADVAPTDKRQYMANLFIDIPETTATETMFEVPEIPSLSSVDQQPANQPQRQESTLRYVPGPVMSTSRQVPSPGDSVNVANCQCGNIIIRRFGFLMGKCETCERFLCMVTNCPFGRVRSAVPYCSTEMAHIVTHLQRCHYNKASNNQCFHCGMLKRRDGRREGRCDYCKAWWCLKGNCQHEVDRDRNLQPHHRYCTGCNN